MSSLAYLPSSPTLFNSGTTHSQMSSCYLLDSPEDSLEGIYKRYTDIAQLSKFAGGIGVAWHRIRSKGSLITGTNGLSNGIVPWLRTLDSSVAAVNQGGRRKGAACVYLESWHADIEDFLELRDNTGDHARRTHNLNIANWVPDLFMERVEKDWQWSLFDPKKVPHLTDLYGADFERAYQQAEQDGLYEKQVSARQLYSRMMRTLAQTGNGWMTFKDSSNLKCNQTGAANADGSPRVVHLSNLCTEILEVTDQDNTAVCNLGSLNLGSYVDAGRRLRLRPARRGRAPGRAVPRPGDRHQLLPDSRGRALQPRVAAGRARADGPAGRVLQAGPGVRLARGAGALQADQRPHLLPRALGVDRARRGRRSARGVRQHARRRRPAAVRPLGHRGPGRARLGRRCAAGSPSTDCATAC